MLVVHLHCVIPLERSDRGIYREGVAQNKRKASRIGRFLDKLEMTSRRHSAPTALPGLQI